MRQQKLKWLVVFALAFTFMLVSTTLANEEYNENTYEETADFPVVHIVAAGDNLFTIARMYYGEDFVGGVDLIVRANGLTDATGILFVGMHLIIPAPDMLEALFQEVTLEQISEILGEVIYEFITEYDFDFAAFVEDAGLSMDEVTQMLLIFANVQEIAESYFWRGENWLYFFIRDMVRDTERDVYWGDYKYAIEILRFLVLLSEAEIILGEGRAIDIFCRHMFWDLESFFGDLEFFAIFIESGAFLTTIQHLANEYGVENVVSALDIDLFADFVLYIEEGIRTTGLTYVDKLVGGLLFENFEYIESLIAEYLYWQSFDWSSDLDMWHDFDDLAGFESFWYDIWAGVEGDILTGHWAEIAAEEAFWLAGRRIILYEFVDISRHGLEHRFSFDLQMTNIWFAEFLYGTDNLNLFLENTGDETVYIAYSIWGSSNFINWKVVRVNPGSDFTIQHSLEEFGLFIDLYVVLLSLTDNPINGELAFRWTAYPAGHESHRP